MQLIADFYVKYYIELTYEQIKDLIFVELTKTMTDMNITKRNQSQYLGMSLRTFYINVKRNNEKAKEITYDKRTLSTSILKYIHDNGITSKRDLLVKFEADFDTEKEESINSVLDSLRYKELVFETGGRGKNKKYYAPIADLPMGDISSIPTAFEDHISTIFDTLKLTVENTLSNQENDTRIRTAKFDFEPGSPAIAELQKIINDFENELREFWEKAKEVNPKMPKETVQVYFGASFPKEQ